MTYDALTDGLSRELLFQEVINILHVLDEAGNIAATQQ